MPDGGSIVLLGHTGGTLACGVEFLRPHARDDALVGGNGAFQVAEPVALVAQVEEHPGDVVEELERTGRPRRLEAGHGALGGPDGGRRLRAHDACDERVTGVRVSAWTGTTAGDGTPYQLKRQLELPEPDAERWLPLLLALKVPESASARNAARTLAPGFQEARTIRQAQKRLTPEERTLIARKYEAGATAADLAVEFGCHTMTVTKAVKANGVTMRFAKKTTADQADEAVRLYGDGLSMEKVGERLGLSGRTIFSILRERGVETRDIHGRNRPT